MNVKALSIFMLLIVTLSFSGVASAATEQVLVQEAYDEQVLVSEAYDEQVLVSEAWNETVLVEAAHFNVTAYSDMFFASVQDWYDYMAAHLTLGDGQSWAYGYMTEVFKEVFHPAVTHEEQVLVQEAYRMWLCDVYGWVGDVFEVVHHEAIYETIVVVDVEAWDEIIPAVYETITVVDQEAYDEFVPPVFEEQVVREVPQGYFNNDKQGEYAEHYEDAVKFANQQVKVHGYDGYFIEFVDDWGRYGHFVVFFTEDVMVQEGYYIHHDAITHEEQVLVQEEQIIHHEAITHEEQVLVQEAYDENVLVEAAHDEFLGHMDVKTAYGWNGYSDMISQVSAMYPNWNLISHPYQDFEAVYETITVVDQEAWTEYISIGHLYTGEMFQFVPDVFETIEHPAVFETVHHDAVYKVVHHDAVYKDVEVADGVPMENTGKGVAVLVIAVLLVLGGLVLARRK